MQYHPEGKLFTGDLMSFEVIPPEGANLEGKRVEVKVPGQTISPVNFQPFGIAARQQATFIWAWDTKDLAAGDYPMEFSVQPGGPTWTETVTLQPRASLPFPEPDAKWAIARSQCCVFHYITGTASERDLPQLMQEADQQANSATESLGVDFTAPITVTLIPRVLGHGGFATDEISVSYLDRNYVGSDFSLVLKHEMVHILDGRIKRDLRPSFLVEGLAVYIVGGHFKLEPLMPRAAALLEFPYRGVPPENSWYIPLKDLVADFYSVQHEIGYLEGASFIQYLVNRFGWDAFSAFYSDIHQVQGGTEYDAIDAALKAHFNIGFADMENGFIQALRGIEVTDANWSDMELTIKYMDTVRRYQQALDPSAYFRTAWLLDNKEMRRRGIVADYLRHPETPQTIALETLLSDAGKEFYAARYEQAENDLDTINLVLDAIQEGTSQPFGVNEVAQKYYDLVVSYINQGYEPQKIDLDAPDSGGQAEIWVTKDGVTLEEFKQ